MRGFVGWVVVLINFAIYLMLIDPHGTTDHIPHQELPPARKGFLWHSLAHNPNHQFTINTSLPSAQLLSSVVCRMETANLGLRLPQLPPPLSPLLNPRAPSSDTPSLRCLRKPNKFRIPSSSSSSSLVNPDQQQRRGQLKFTDDENRLIEALIGIQGRGRSASPQQFKEVDNAVQILEELKGIPDPTNSSLIEGRWQLMFTTRPRTASPIQRTFVGADFFSVFQEVYLRINDPRVCNIVKFSDSIGELKVEAEASIENGKRILFRFDRAAFSFKFLPFKVPYPVPFRLLGDEAKGWLDTTYLSYAGNFRISRGNKGTTFVLQKETETRQQLLAAISTGSGVREALDKLILSNTSTETDGLELLEGEWKMIWSSQIETDSWLENAANGLMGSQIIKANGQLKFVVDILFGFKFSVSGKFSRTGSKAYDITMDDAAIRFGQFGLPVEIVSKFNLELLYTDNSMRITRGYNNITFVHLRVQ
ncbi:Probable plastid-lipid-associated protein 12, chloroplastic [Dionaea muscipula]